LADEYFRAKRAAMSKIWRDLMFTIIAIMAMLSALSAQTPTNALPKDAEAAKHGFEAAQYDLHQWEISGQVRPSAII
jgi:hypothetical protein